jgi:hypothetical protein
MVHKVVVAILVVVAAAVTVGAVVAVVVHLTAKPKCKTDADCKAPLSKCNRTTGACVAPTGSCTADTDCPHGQRCGVDKQCYCTTDATCPNGQKCGADKRCYTPTSTGCTTDTDCPHGQTCGADKQCYCTTDATCPSGQKCGADKRCYTPSGEQPRDECIGTGELGDRQCTAIDPRRPVCRKVDGWHRCTPECSAEHACPSSGPNRVCDTAAQRCVECLQRTGQCPAPKVCDTATRRCIECDGAHACQRPYTYCKDGACTDLVRWRRARMRIKNLATATCLGAYSGGSAGPLTTCQGGEPKLTVARTTNTGACVAGGGGAGGVPKCDNDRECTWTVERVDVPGRASEVVVRLQRAYDPGWCAVVDRDYNDGFMRSSETQGFVRQQCGGDASLMVVHGVEPPAAPNAVLLQPGTRFRLRPLKARDGHNLGVGAQGDKFPWWTRTGSGLSDVWIVDDLVVEQM